MDRALDSRDGAQPIHNDQLPGVDPCNRDETVTPSETEDEQSKNTTGESSPATLLIEGCEQPDNVEGVEGVEDDIKVDSLTSVDDTQGIDIPLPDIVGGVEERTQLIEEQSSDESLN